MSAFVVSKTDIDILVTAYLALLTDTRKADVIGRELWRENVKSVAYLYRMPQRHADEHAAYLAAIKAYRYEPFFAKAAAVAKMARYFDYQTCEHPEWDETPPPKAKAIIEALFKAFPDTLPGYDAAPWGIATDGDLEAVRV